MPQVFQCGGQGRQLSFVSPHPCPTWVTWCVDCRSTIPHPSGWSRSIENNTRSTFMRLANALAAALVLLAGAAGVAAAQGDVADEGQGVFYSHIYVDMGTGLQYTPKGFVMQLVGDVYNNTNPTPSTLGAVASTDLNAQWGDRVTTTGTGVLQENDFTIFNSGTSAGPLLST